MSITLADTSDAALAARRGIVDITVDPGPADLRVALRAEPSRPYKSFLTVLARLGAGAVFASLTAISCRSPDRPVTIWCS